MFEASGVDYNSGVDARGGWSGWLCAVQPRVIVQLPFRICDPCLAWVWVCAHERTGRAVGVGLVLSDTPFQTKRWPSQIPEPLPNLHVLSAC